VALVKPELVKQDLPDLIIERRDAGKQARRFREAHGMTRRQVADAIGISESRVYQLERGSVPVDNWMYKKLTELFTSGRVSSPITAKSCKRCSSVRPVSEFNGESGFCDHCEETMNQPRRTPQTAAHTRADEGATAPMMGHVEVAANPPPSRESIIEWLGQQLKDERTITAKQIQQIAALQDTLTATQDELALFQEENTRLETRIKELETPKAPEVSNAEAALLSSLGCPGFGPKS
jgi:DNA-binding XRE family transcriptional regulator